MKHRSLKIRAFFFFLIFVFSLLPNVFVFTASAADFEFTTKIAATKVISNATIDDDFANNAILIVLNKEETQMFNEYV